MSTSEILLVIALILILIDVIFVSDIPTYTAYALAATAISMNFEVEFFYQVLVGVVTFFSLIVFHYVLWRKVLESINDKFISPKKYASGMEALIGQQGKATIIDGQILLNVKGSLFKVINVNDVVEGNTYTVKNVDSTNVIIS